MKANLPVAAQHTVWASECLIGTLGCHLIHFMSWQSVGREEAIFPERCGTSLSAAAWQIEAGKLEVSLAMPKGSVQ